MNHNFSLRFKFMRFSYGFNLLRILANQVHIDQFVIHLILTRPHKALTLREHCTSWRY
ncbi:hypothetical protein VCRA2121O436_60039 [Vibrio crassostreae]|nr:hypothetical protein VCRA2113O420_60039 [Vibrio crassostreae]CAK3565928.1 hypothetical protein VCRA2121O436_60039 [Vibrio crassostreae]